MNKFNLDSAKFVSIIIGICFVFVMVIWHAFNYLPAKDGNNFPVENSTETRIEEQEIVSEESDDESEAEAQEENQEEVKYVEQDIPQFEPIEVEKGNIGENEEQTSSFEALLNRAQDYTQENNIQNAISEYQKALSLTNDTKEKAQCYEEIAWLYAQAKRYGSALSFAQKAYNASPSTSREVLLARLYYKTGDIGKATNRVNNVLRRDFIKNDK